MAINNTKMDVSSLEQNYQALINHLIEIKFPRVKISSFRAEIKRLISYASSSDVLSYDDYYEKMYGEGKFGVPLWKSMAKKKQIHQIQQFVELGISPEQINELRARKPSTYLKLCDEFKSLVDHITNRMKDRHLAESSINIGRNLFASFLWSIESDYNIHSVDAIDENVIYKFFTKNESQRYGATTVNRIKRSFEDCSTHNLSVECLRVAKLIPKPVNIRRIYPEMSDTSKRMIEKYILDESNNLSYRDRAIMILIYYTGLRGCDVANLKLTDIDWENNKIRIIQSKTKVEWCIKLEPILGNTIFNYLKYERYKVNIPNLFLAHDHRYRGVSPKTIGAICSRVMQAAGIEPKANKFGSHVFRHKIATDLLEFGIDIPTISAILGHTQPISVNTYLSVSDQKLKECALSIEDYPYTKYQK
jgi:site-specific recombinase XerD